MNATRTTELVSFGGKLAAIIVLAAALAYGPLAQSVRELGALRRSTQTATSVSRGANTGEQ